MTKDKIMESLDRFLKRDDVCITDIMAFFSACVRTDESTKRVIKGPFRADEASLVLHTKRFLSEALEYGCTQADVATIGYMWKLNSNVRLSLLARPRWFVYLPDVFVRDLFIEKVGGRVLPADKKGYPATGLLFPSSGSDDLSDFGNERLVVVISKEEAESYEDYDPFEYLDVASYAGHVLIEHTLSEFSRRTFDGLLTR